jgi:hypothetical protein
MKVNRDDLKWFIDNIERRAEGKKLSNEELADKLAHYMEANPRCVDLGGKPKRGRYYYSTVGYGVFSLIGEKYRIGRIEIFDKESDSGYQIDEGTYCLPFEVAGMFEDFIESLETDLPINIEIGSHQQCDNAAAEALGIPVDKLNDSETKREYYRKKSDIYAQEKGYKDWDELLENSKFGKKHEG